MFLTLIFDRCISLYASLRWRKHANFSSFFPQISLLTLNGCLYVLNVFSVFFFVQFPTRDWVNERERERRNEMKMKRKKIKTSRQARKVDDDVENDDENENYLFTYASARPDQTSRQKIISLILSPDFNIFPHSIWKLFYFYFVFFSLSTHLSPTLALHY